MVNFTSDGRTTQKTHQQEYEQAGPGEDMGKIGWMILFVLLVIDRFKKRQPEWIRKEERAT